jgi:hypothetical protein
MSAPSAVYVLVLMARVFRNPEALPPVIIPDCDHPNNEFLPVASFLDTAEAILPGCQYSSGAGLTPAWGPRVVKERRQHSGP